MLQVYGNNLFSSVFILKKYEYAGVLCKTVVHLILNHRLAKHLAIYECMNIIHSRKLPFKANHLLFRLHADADLCANDFHFHATSYSVLLYHF